MPSFFPNDQFATNNKSNNRSNNAVVKMKELFLNIEYKLSYKSLTKKAI